MKIHSGLVLVIVSMTLLSNHFSAGQGTRCDVNGGKVDNTAWDHCLTFRQTGTMWYTYDATDLKACVEAKTDGWFGVGFGGNGSDYVIGWGAGGTQTVGDYKGHTSTVRDATQDHTAHTPAAGSVGEGNGYTTFCFQRKLNTGDGDDTPISVDDFMNFPWAYRNGDPANAQNLDAEQHAQDGTVSYKLADPTEERITGGGNGGNDEGDANGGGPGGDNGALIGVGVAAGALLLLGAMYMVKKNNAQVNMYSNGGGGVHGGYSSSGSHTSGGRSHGSRSHKSSRSRSSQASHRSRSKGSRSHGSRSHGSRSRSRSRH